MNRRNFLKILGIGAVAPLKTLKVNKTFEDKVLEKVLKPEDIVKDPDSFPKYDLNDDVTGVAYLWTVSNCYEWLKYNLNVENARALLKFSANQNSAFGLSVAKAVVSTLMNYSSKPTRNKWAPQIMDSPEFKLVILRFGNLLTKHLG